MKPNFLMRQERRAKRQGDQAGHSPRPSKPENKQFSHHSPPAARAGRKRDKNRKQPHVVTSDM